MTELESQADTPACPRCGAGLRCGMLAGDAGCWCAQLPRVMPVPAAQKGAACFCPACLKQITDEHQNAVSPTSD